MKSTIKNFIKQTDIETAKEIFNFFGLRQYTNALARGYISRKTEGYIEDYKGKYGIGFALNEPNFISSRYYHKTYYVF